MYNMCIMYSIPQEYILLCERYLHTASTTIKHKLHRLNLFFNFMATNEMERFFFTENITRFSSFGK